MSGQSVLAKAGGSFVQGIVTLPVLRDTNIVAFVPTTDFGRARAFYEGILGLRFKQEDGFALVLDANGIMLRITKIPVFEPARFTILGWEVQFAVSIRLGAVAVQRILQGPFAIIEEFQTVRITETTRDNQPADHASKSSCSLTSSGFRRHLRWS